MKKFTLAALVVLLAAAAAVVPARAQLLLVTGEYRVTGVDRSDQRIGIALREDDPNQRQNWIYVKPDTVIVKRSFYKNGTFRDEYMSYNGFFDYVRKGTLMRVHGGRDWDGSIDAKKIWM